MEELAAIDHHLFLLFLHMVHTVFSFQITYDMGNNMQYPTCCWCLLLSFVDACRMVFSSQRSAKRPRLTMWVFLITQPQCWGQDKGSWIEQQRGIEGINWAPVTDFSTSSPEEISFGRHPCPYEPTWKENRQKQYTKWRKDQGYNLHLNKKSNVSLFKWHRNVTTEHVKARTLSFYHNSSRSLLQQDINW